MIGVMLHRRFRGDGRLTELCHLAELAALPCKGWQVDFADGTGIGVVAWGKITLRDFSPGVHPPQVAIYFDSEPPERLELARQAGWKETPP
jgi:hypothetical protein